MGVFIASCIQGGASLARSEGAQTRKAVAAAANARWRILILHRGGAGLQDNLLFIAGPHGLEEFAESEIVFNIENNNVHIQLAFQMEGAFVVLYVQGVEDDVTIHFL